MKVWIFFVAEFTHGILDKRWPGRRRGEWWWWPKKIITFEVKKGWHHQLPHRVTLTLVTSLLTATWWATFCVTLYLSIRSVWICNSRLEGYYRQFTLLSLLYAASPWELRLALSFWDHDVNVHCHTESPEIIKCAITDKWMMSIDHTVFKLKLVMMLPLQSVVTRLKW